MSKFLKGLFSTAKASEVEKTKPQLPTITFNDEWLTPDILAEGVRALRDFPETAEPTPEMIEATRDSARGDLGKLYPLLIAAGIPKARAKEINLNVHSRLTSLISRTRSLALGITKAEWIYSGAPCIFSVKNPRAGDDLRDAEHRAANGKTYSLADGFLMNGRYVHPGEESGCKCRSRVIVEFKE